MRQSADPLQNRVQMRSEASSPSSRYAAFAEMGATHYWASPHRHRAVWIIRLSGYAGYRTLSQGRERAEISEAGSKTRELLASA